MPNAYRRTEERKAGEQAEGDVEDGLQPDRRRAKDFDEPRDDAEEHADLGHLVVYACDRALPGQRTAPAAVDQGEEDDDRSGAAQALVTR